MDMDTLLCLKCRTNRDQLSSTGDSAQRYVAAWMGGELGGEGIHVYAWLSPFTVHLKLSLLLIGYTLIKSKSSKQTKKSPGIYIHALQNI